jgi:3-methyladenine DNA glycosylase AlkD
MAFDTAEAAADLESELRARGTPERAEGEKRYLKSDLDFAGCTVGQTRAVVKAFLSSHPGLGHDEVVALAARLWAVPVHERRAAAAMLLDARGDRLGPSDVALVERLVREARTWALVDPLAVSVLGGLLRRHPELLATIDVWAADPDFWVRRAALLAFLVPLRHGGDFAPFARLADAMAEEREFFIRKAIGWVLRETSKRRPDDVYAWLVPRTHRISGVTVREAVKHLDPARRDEVMEAYRERRPV